MLPDLFFIGAGLVLLYLGAEGLVRGASSFAVRAGLTPLVVGLTIVAFATGTPELFVSVKGATTGEAGIALGNVIGSNISNLALVLGLAALVSPMSVRSELVRREMPLCAGATVLLVVLLLDGRLSRIDGLLLFSGAIAYTVGAYANARKDAQDIAATEFREDIELLRSRGVEVAFMLGGVALLAGGAELLTRGAVALATRVGVDPAVVALTVIAVGTSLPELAASVSAARTGQPDVAFGNVIGSNTFNILGVLGVVAIIHPFAAEGIRPLDYVVFVGSVFLVMVLMARGWVLNRWEGLLLVVLYAIFLLTMVT